LYWIIYYSLALSLVGLNSLVHPLKLRIGHLECETKEEPDSRWHETQQTWRRYDRF